MSANIEIRRAGHGDRDAIRALHALSLRTLATAFYEAEAIEAFIAAGTVDETLLDDGTCLLALREDVVVGTGGWSTRAPGFAEHQTSGPALLPDGRPAVRAVFVHPRAARQGIATRLMRLIESEIAAAGHASAGLTSTLSGVPLYRRLGWRADDAVAIEIRGKKLFGIAMSKRLVWDPGISMRHGHEREEERYRARWGRSG